MATSVARSASPPAGRCNPSWIASTPFALSGDTFQTPTYIPAPRSPGRPGRTSARHADCLPLWGWSDDLQAELGRIGIALIPRDQEVLEARRLEDDQDPRRLTLDGESVGEIPRQGRVRAGLDVDALIADEGGDRSLEDVERLVLARMSVDRRGCARAGPPPRERPP